MSSGTRDSGYIRFLPAIYQQNPFLERFLAAFEQVIAGDPEAGPGEPPGIEQQIDRIAERFDPDTHAGDGPEAARLRAWLAGWVALELRDDWGEASQRKLIRRMASLYPMRGTRAGVERLLRIYAGDGVGINDNLAAMQVGVSSVLGRDTVLGGLPPHVFIVNIKFAEANPERVKAMADAVEALLDVEKPAHTGYELRFEGLTLQVGVLERATLGVNTII